MISRRLARESDLDITSEAFLRWLHRELYDRLPDELRYVRRRESGERVRVLAGELRGEAAIVGRHIGPDAGVLPRFLIRFAERYDPSRLRPLERIIASAASHHRLLWLHPFLDGNGRVARLFTEAYLRRVELDSHGLWSISRGLARSGSRYIELLERADQPRRDDYDGRGNLSEAALVEFCRFFLETALDQVRYMGGLLDLDGLDRRIRGYVNLRARGLTPDRRRLRPEAAPLLRDVALRGEVPRGDVARVTGLSERTARRLIGELAGDGLLTSETPKGPLRLGLPAAAAPYLFPGLFPSAPVSGTWVRE